LTAAGLKAIAVDEGPQEAIEPGEASQPQLLPEAKNGVSLDDAGRLAPTAAPRDGSKLALLIELLRRADGATIVDLTQTTGWLAHTTRAAITGLRKRVRQSVSGKLTGHIEGGWLGSSLRRDV
jgi:hypothetical protein